MKSRAYAASTRKPPYQTTNTISSGMTTRRRLAASSSNSCDCSTWSQSTLSGGLPGSGSGKACDGALGAHPSQVLSPDPVVEELLARAQRRVELFALALELLLADAPLDLVGEDVGGAAAVAELLL